jgi:hypothetical protein
VELPLFERLARTEKRDMAQDDRQESRRRETDEREEHRRGRTHQESREARHGSAPEQQRREAYGEVSPGEPPRYTGSQPGYGAHGMGYGPQGGAWGVYGMPRELARDYASGARSGAPQGFDQPHGRESHGGSGSFGSGGEHPSFSDPAGPRETGGQHEVHERSAHGSIPPAQHARAGEARRRGPKGYQRSDERIGEVIYERLVDARGIDPSDVTIEVKDGVVTLYGSVAHRQMKYWIEDIAADTFGVKDVENKLRVALTAPWPMTSGRGVR